MPNRHQPQSSSRPEQKFGPFPGGISVAVWRNTADTDDGPRPFRSITITPRRYRDPQSGEWKDSPSFRPADLPALIFGLQKALEFMYTTPLAGQEEADGDQSF